MYSYEDRMRAVELYVKLGKRLGATIRQLRYPTKNSLKAWCRQYERGLDLPKGYRPVGAHGRQVDAERHAQYENVQAQARS